MPGFTGRALGDFSRSPVHAAFKARIPKPTLPAIGNLESLFRGGQIAKQFTGINVMNHRTARNVHIEIFTRATGLVTTFTTLAAFCPILSGNTKIDQCIDGRICDQVNAATMPAVATIRSATLHIFLTTKTKTTVTTVACLNPNCRLVNESHNNSVATKTKNPAHSGVFKMNL